MAKVQLQLFERKRKEDSGVGRACVGEGGSRFCALGVLFKEMQARSHWETPLTLIFSRAFENYSRGLCLASLRDMFRSFLCSFSQDFGAWSWCLFHSPHPNMRTHTHTHIHTHTHTPLLEFTSC